MPELICTVCGKPRAKGRRQCASCYRTKKCADSKEHYKKYGRKWYYPTCIICKQPYKVSRKTSTICPSCRNSRNKPTASYEYSESAKGKTVWQHRVLAVEVLKRELKTHETVHHLNEQKNDNELTNLIVLSRKTHAKLHHFTKIQKLIFLADIQDSEQQWQKIVTSVTLNWLDSNNVQYIKLWKI